MATDPRDMRRDYWRLLDLYEDYLAGGFRKRHDDPPAFPAPLPAAPVRSPAASGSPGVSGRATARSLTAEERTRELASIAGEIAACRKCGLCEKRTHAVPGIGVLDPVVMVVGEGPGEEEDLSGFPFVGAAGKYLDKWLEAIGLSRTANAYIANVVKCRPPFNRDPEPDEMGACLPYLRRQISLIRPAFILTVGRISTQALTGKTSGIGTLRGSVFSFEGIPLLPTYHPSGVLRNQDLRRAVWDDLKTLKTMIDESGARADH